MYSKIQIKGTIEVLTGMHIGGSTAFAAIGAIDSPVIRDALTNLPIIPGSSLKGKLRTLLAKQYNIGIKSPDDDSENICRLFGTSKKNAIRASRILFSDMIMTNAEELRDMDVQSLTEVKFENSINRQTAVANPRQIERVIRGAKFELDCIYEAENEEEIIDDIKLLAEGMKLLEYDYIGGSGSRGYGKIKFLNVLPIVVVGKVNDEILKQLEEIFKNF
ncbi:MAG: type III-A CRISPR-associated RAMP protein Csm3 [Clostridium sp.]|nr:type III-A CRISPR-associated RAMP protein Csm3 [Clostridium sp.]